MKLTNIRKLGRYINHETGRSVNVHTGRKKGYSIDILFFFHNGTRVIISDRDFYNNWGSKSESKSKWSF